MKKAFIVELNTEDTDFQSVADELFELIRNGGHNVTSVKPFAPKGKGKLVTPLGTTVRPAFPGGTVQ